MFIITPELLQTIGFKYDKFPDGFFWHITASTDAEKVRLSKALGMAEDVVEDIPDDVIIQTDDGLTDWQYVYGADAGPMTYKGVVECISYLAKELGVSNR